jgi:dethiobiotin synthetase
MSFFITGTDTDVGKTWVTVALLRAWRAMGRKVVGMKPIACGGREDAEALLAASEHAITLGEVNPIWLQPPVAPYAAAMIEERAIDLPLIRETFAALRARFPSVLVEGAGGWMVPIMRDYAVCDLAADVGLPVVVVAANKLGVLNHTLLTVDAIIARGLPCAGVVLNQTAVPTAYDPAVVTNPAILEELLATRGVAYLGEVEYGATVLPPRLLALGS